MYKFYKDKNENFECNIGLEGASLSKAQARLVLENEEFNLVFKGSIDTDGKCIIPIKKLKVLSEGLTGKLKLEVIVEDDTYFMPYQDDFVVEINKKLTVEVKEQKTQDTKKLTVEVADQNNIILVVNEIVNKFNKKGINLLNIKNKVKDVNTIISETINKYNIKDSEIKLIQEKLLDKLQSYSQKLME